MINYIKKLLPKSIKTKLLPIKAKLIDNPKKRKLFLHMQNKHQELLQEIKGKEKIKVVFLAIHKSVWKVDPVFKKMLDDPYFEPLILVCPYVPYGRNRMLNDLKGCYDYFQNKGYPVVNSYDEDNDKWVTLEKINPDIVFFTNPHNLTRKEYYEDAYLNYLSCYVPYSFDVSRYDNYVAQYNQVFHNAIWLIFAPHKADLDIYKSYSQGKSNNVVMSGYPFIESFFNKDRPLMVWKSQNKIKRKLIWAPHHTIDNPSLPYASFLKIAEFMKSISLKFSSEVQFAFKPHPILKSKLYIHPDWGKEKTDDYYSYWSNAGNTQYCDGEYIDLFLESDAMIHDSGSFLAEYLFLSKPVLFTSNLEIECMKQFYNEFGLSALHSHYIAEGKEQKDKIELFIREVITDEIEINKNHQRFISDNKACNEASDFILNEIKNKAV
ncbi:CDP-glycerol glycerophosphotransferase family protein [Vibrio metschnikovii]|nr:CDP-glycerol glycerophosphotransferase family protein [Vibrio metschnikovii]EKO3746250.1 CDP-glycerol glycerophosphotransferase family protein [Vibrio metschnikovii]